MRKLILILAVIICSCQRELIVPEPTQLEKNKQLLQGKWKLLSFSDNFGDTFTNAEPCYADDTFELLPGTGVISQGPCIEYPAKPRDISFAWNFINDSTVNFGGDTVILQVCTINRLKFKRDHPYFQYEYFK